MRIGVVTFWHGNGNYGMMLQCWALQQVLKNLGHSPFVIRFCRPKKKGLPRKLMEAMGIYGFFLYFINREKYQLNQKKKRHDILRRFEQFRQENLSLSSNKYSTLQQIRDSPPPADCYIVGSDQVWSQGLDNCNNQVYYLNFGTEKVKRISYAPSFGFSKYPDSLLPTLRKALSRFDAISCREQSGVEICRQLGFEATKVLDPTMLLDKHYYEAMAAEHRPLTDNPYVFIYSLNIKSSDEIRFEELESYMKTNALDLVVTPADGYCQGLEIYGNKAIYSYATIGQWLSNILHSSLVITPSFHGVVLSIILEKPFIYSPLRGQHAGGNERITGILQALGLEARMLLDNKSVLSIIQKNIDWIEVRHKLTKLRNESLSFLSQSLTEK